MWCEYNSDKMRLERTSLPPLVEPTGLFSLTGEQKSK